MRNKLYLFFSFILVCNLYAQDVEKIRTINEIKYQCYPGGGASVSPEGLYFNEVENIAVCFNPRMNEFYSIDLNETSKNFIKKEEGRDPASVVFDAIKITKESKVLETKWHMLILVLLASFIIPFSPLSFSAFSNNKISIIHVI